MSAKKKLRYLIKKNDVWQMANEEETIKFFKNNGMRKIIEIEEDELFIIFGEKMSVFTYEGKKGEFHLHQNERDYDFGGRVKNKVDRDIYVYKRKNN